MARGTLFKERCIAAADDDVKPVGSRKSYNTAAAWDAEVSLLGITKEEKGRIPVEILIPREIHLRHKASRAAKD